MDIIYLSDATSKSLDVVVGGFYDLNRTYDRCVSILQNTWSMPQASDIVHHKLSHLFPIMADFVADFKSQYNVNTAYPETHADARTYTNLLDMMETVLKETGNQYEMIKATYKVAHENGDVNACAMLFRLTRMMSVVMDQVITLRDKAEQLPTYYDAYDRHITSWGIDGIDLDTVEEMI